MSNWFTVDKAGLAAILERRGKAWALFELIQNAWDSGTRQVNVRLDPVPNEPYAMLSVEDFGEGFGDFTQAHTMFARSSRASDPEKRGRFNLGEKLVLACCRWAEITTTTGTLTFVDDGTRRTRPLSRSEGTLFSAKIRMTRDEYRECSDAINQLIPPVETLFNGSELHRPTPFCTFQAKLPTEIADQDGQLRRTVRTTTVEVYEPEDGLFGDLLELGIPVVDLESPYRINVLQKVPLNMDRDNVTPGFLRAVHAALLNNIHERLTPGQAATPWAQEAAGDARATKEAVKSVVTKRFGDRAVIANPADPMANASAASLGFTVVPGGAFSANTWANVKKHEILIPSSRMFSGPKPEALAKAVEEAAKVCPACKRPFETRDTTGDPDGA
jgi:hypothetical protein